MDKKEFLSRRQQGIGGSDIAAIIGISPWRTPRDIYLDKKGMSEPTEETEAMYWGTTLEDIVAKEYCKRTGFKVEKCNYLFKHKEYPFLIGNIDRAVCENGKKPVVKGELRTKRILECKTANSYSSNEWGESGTQVIPEFYKAQVQWYMGLTGAEFCDVAVLIGGRDFRMYEIKRDDNVIDYLFNEGINFWRNFVENDIMPPPVSIEDVEKVCTGKSKERKFASDEIIELVEKYSTLNNDISELEEELKKLKLKICEYMGDAEELCDTKSKKLVTWSASKPTVKIDYKAIIEEIKPDKKTIEKHTTIYSGTRRFVLKR